MTHDVLTNDIARINLIKKFEINLANANYVYLYVFGDLKEIFIYDKSNYG